MKPPTARASFHKILVLTLLLLTCAGSIGLGAVWVRQEISQLANRNKGHARRLAELDRRLDELDAEIAVASSPDRLLHQNEAMRLGLVQPREEQVTRVDVSPETLLVARRNQESVGLRVRPVVFRLATAGAPR